MLHSFTANYVFPISSPPVKDGVVITDENGTILAVLSREEFMHSQYYAETRPEKLEGILCPGFINAHCHLELSHLQGKLQAGTNLPGFIGEIIKVSAADPQVIERAIEKAEEEMIENGIVGVGDICNTADTLEQKKKKKLRYHNFIEVFDVHPSNADKEFEKGAALLEKFRDAGSSASLVPHAPYSVTPQLLKRVYEYAYVHDSILTFHNQETESENEMFKSRSGRLFEKLSSLGTLYNDWKSTGFNSLASALVHLPRCNKTLLVHNTFTTLEDINWAHLYSAMMYWCMCPNANLYIENRLPDFQTFIESSCRLLIGTDSYASNRSLSVLEELKTISRHTPKIKLDSLLRWATLNGADFFGWKKELGSLEAGKRPGINLVTDINIEALSLTESSEVRLVLKP